jgi:predicted amidohydrolase
MTKWETARKRLSAHARLPAIAALALALSGCPIGWGPCFDFTTPSTLGAYSAPTTYDDSGAPTRLQVASVAMTCSRDPAANLAAMTAMVDRIIAERPDVDLILFGETILGWYFDATNPEAYQRSVAEALPGASSAAIAALASSRTVWIGYGFAESDGTALYNTFALFDRGGALRAKHRKSVLVPFLDDANGFGRGDPIATVVDVEGVRTSVSICADVHSAALAASIASADVDLVLSPMADAGVYDMAFWPPGPQYDAWVVTANRNGTEGATTYRGSILACDPAGKIRSYSSGADGYIVLDVGAY